MNVEDMRNFGDLDQDKEYIVNLRAEDKYVTHIKVLFKGKKVIFIEKIDPNKINTFKEWYEMGDDDDLIEVYEELTNFNRENKLNEILEEEKN